MSESRDCFSFRSLQDVLNTLNGFGLGASDVFVKLVSVLVEEGIFLEARGSDLSCW